MEGALCGIIEIDEIGSWGYCSFNGTRSFCFLSLERRPTDDDPVLIYLNLFDWLHLIVA